MTKILGSRLGDLKSIETVEDDDLFMVEQNIGTRVISKKDLFAGLDSNVDNVKTRMDNSGFIHDITTERHVHKNGTSYYLTRVPFNDKNKIKKSWACDIPNTEGNSSIFTKGEYPREHAKRKKATLAINASGWYSSYQVMGTQVKDGVAYQNSPNGSVWWTLGVDQSGVLNAFPPTYSANKLVNDYKIVNTFTFHMPLIMDKEKVGDEIFSHLPVDRANRQIVAQIYDTKEIIILTCDGRTDYNIGMTYDECIVLLKSLNVDFAYAVDGGGSAQTILYGSLINIPYDKGLGFTERMTSDILYFSDEDIEEEQGWVKDINKISDVVTKNHKDISNLEIKKRNYNDNLFKNQIEVEADDALIYLKYLKSQEDLGRKPVPGIVLRDVDKKNVRKLILTEELFGVYDYILNKHVLKVDNEGNISTVLGELGNFLSNIKLITTPLNDITKSGIYWVNPNTPGYVSTGALLHITVGSQDSLQVLFSFNNNVKSIKRNKSGGVWSEWANLM